MAVKHSPGGNTPSNTTRAGEWLFTNQSGKGPTGQTDWYSSQGKPSDGDGGGFDDSGGVSNLAGDSNLWLFKGTTPFLLTINDISNDEETLLGWMEHENTPFFPSISQLNDYLTTRDDILILE